RAVARALAGLLRNDNKVADDLKAMSQTHNTHGRLSADEFKSVNEIDFLTCDMPMLQFSDKEQEVLDAQITYALTTGSI
ncbi:MAG: hypothetical protein WC301_04385, partial [Candidatus Omnitrophota bacterium]